MFLIPRHQKSPFVFSTVKNTKRLAHAMDNPPSTRDEGKATSAQTRFTPVQQRVKNTELNTK